MFRVTWIQSVSPLLVLLTMSCVKRPHPPEKATEPSSSPAAKQDGGDAEQPGDTDDLGDAVSPAGDGEGDDAIAPGDEPGDQPPLPGDGDSTGPGPDPDCFDNTDCAADQTCLLGVCRDPCLLSFWCEGVSGTGNVCVDGLCVQCENDFDCRGGHARCETAQLVCEPEPIDPDQAVVGVMYHQWWIPNRWHTDPKNYANEPLLGHYDNTDSAVIQQHMAWSERAGINTWVLDTWITDRDDWWVVPNTTAVMDHLDGTDMRYFILVDGWFEYPGNTVGYDPDAIATRVVNKFGPWLNRPGYMKVDGKPVLFFWAAARASCELFSAVRERIEAQIGPVYLTGHGGETECWDRVMIYNSYTPESADYDRQLAAQRGRWEDYEDREFPWSPTVIPGYDDTNVRAGNPAVDINPDFFRDGLRQAFAYNQHGEHPWLFICSWSEWHEGSTMEPSTAFDPPEIFLDVLREELETAGWR